MGGQCADYHIRLDLTPHDFLYSMPLKLLDCILFVVVYLSEDLSDHWLIVEVEFLGLHV